MTSAATAAARRAGATAPARRPRPKPRPKAADFEELTFADGSKPEPAFATESQDDDDVIELEAIDTSSEPTAPKPSGTTAPVPDIQPYLRVGAVGTNVTDYTKHGFLSIILPYLEQANGDGQKASEEPAETPSSETDVSDPDGLPVRVPDNALTERIETLTREIHARLAPS